MFPFDNVIMLLLVYRNLKEIMFDLAVSTMPAEEQALLDGRTSAGEYTVGTRIDDIMIRYVTWRQILIFKTHG